MNTMIRTRFCPSPTGKIHLGNVRTGLFSALFATKHQGVFVLRIEDTDRARSEERYVAMLEADLHWLGIDWQEGPGKDGTVGPYWQSQRQSLYEKYYKELEEKKYIYPCFCTDQELNLARKIQLGRGQAPRYGRTCQRLSPEEIAQRLAAGQQPAWRLMVPAHQKIEFVDSVKGSQSFNSDDIGDFIVRRADGTAPFLFCNAIDDALMGITHVLRGEDHLANTPRQILLLQMLGMPIPHYGHLSLIVGEDGAPLSKRHGSFSVEEMRTTGYLPIALINYLTRLGHGCDTTALLPFAQLADYFYLEKLSRSAARFDKNQLLFWQKAAIQALDSAALWEWLGDAIKEKIPSAAQALFAKTIQANILFPQEADEWATIFFQDDLIFDEAARACIQAAGETFFATAQTAFNQWDMDGNKDVNNAIAQIKQTLNVSGKALFMPLRIALTGKAHGPELVAVVELLGIKKIQTRLEHAKQLARGTEVNAHSL